jgi:hypothetical protein
MFQQLLRCFCCYDGSDWTTLLPQVEFAYNAARTLGIEHTPFEANFGFSPEEPPDLLFSMRPSIPVSQDATERLRFFTRSTYLGTLSVTATQRRDASAHKTVYNATLHQRRQGVSRHNKPFSAWTTEPETQRQTAWTFYNGGADWETQLQIETTSDSTLTSCAPCEQSTTLLYRSATTNCPGQCS